MEILHLLKIKIIFLFFFLLLGLYCLIFTHIPFSFYCPVMFLPKYYANKN